MLIVEEDRTFPELVRSFCELVERPPGSPLKTLHDLREVLAALYAAALELPDFYDTTDEELPRYLWVEDALFEIEENLRNCTGLDSFWLFEEPFGIPLNHPRCLSVSDELAQLWQELKPGLLALEEDEDRWRNDVFWHWKLGFHSRWGTHAVDSIWAIHRLLRDAPPVY